MVTAQNTKFNKKRNDDDKLPAYTDEELHAFLNARAEPIKIGDTDRIEKIKEAYETHLEKIEKAKADAKKRVNASKKRVENASASTDGSSNQGQQVQP